MMYTPPRHEALAIPKTVPQPSAMFALAGQRRRSRGLLSWLLGYALLAQALFPIQAHTQWGTGPDGMVVVICTFQGERTEVVGDDSQDTNALDEYRSPACVFSSLLGATIATSPSLQPSGLLRSTASSTAPIQDLSDHGPALTQAIRAPPSA